MSLQGHRGELRTSLKLNQWLHAFFNDLSYYPQCKDTHKESKVMGYGCPTA